MRIVLAITKVTADEYFRYLIVLIILVVVGTRFTLGFLTSRTLNHYRRSQSGIPVISRSTDTVLLITGLVAIVGYVGLPHLARWLPAQGVWLRSASNFLIFLCAVAAIVFILLTRKKWRQHIRRSGFELCLNCGYSLRGLPDKWKCPECGCSFDKSLVRYKWDRFVRERR
jgi:hypothetical protein